MADSAAYEKLADEYYHIDRHPTSSNFHEASSAILRQWANTISPPGSVICEVGPGRSTIVEVLGSAGTGTRNIIFLDTSLRMLKHVSEISGRTLFLKGDASRMPLKSQSVDFIFAGLGDPYNTNAFWSEATRILRPGAAVIFTTPSFEWMSAFRAEPERSHALFELTHGGQVSAPSFIFPEQQQRALIEATGLRVEGVLRVILGDLKLTPISPKLLPARGRRAPVVTGFLARC